MLIQVDAKALEWLVAVAMSEDPVGRDEIIHNKDQHTANQERFGLPDRHTAKTFVFRLIYGGTAYSYANDPNFTKVSTSQSFWQRVIDEFYNKYAGLARWHEALVQEATTTGMLRMPTGRIFKYRPEERRGDLVWPRTTILNYPVQGTGADIMCVARVSFARRFKAAGIRGVLVSTVHDSIVVDVEDSETQRVVNMFFDVFDDIPANLIKIFNWDIKMPTRCEVEYGSHLGKMVKTVDRI